MPQPLTILLTITVGAFALTNVGRNVPVSFRGLTHFIIIFSAFLGNAQCFDETKAFELAVAAAGKILSVIERVSLKS